jgi:BirA family biotin operon repressor/biotin-[acetyl-CoA-carboxylase] ligase
VASPYTDLDRPPLRAAALRRALVAPGRLITDVEVVAEIGSTNAELRSRALDGAPEGVLLVAEHQTAGRGRLERTWTSPPRAGLTFSVLLRPGSQVPGRRWPWLPLLVGCAVVEAIASVSETAKGVSLEPELKWPNDILLGDRKLCGILVERVDTQTGPAAVAGVGLNVTSTASELPDTATSLRLSGATTTDRPTLLIAIVRMLDALYSAWRSAAGDPEAGPGGGLRRAYRRRCATIGREVEVRLGGDRRVVGRATDVDGDGRLVVVTEEGERSFNAGEVVHLRPAEGPTRRD